MSRKCELCGKGPVSGNTVSHSNIKTKRRWLPNLQKSTIVVDGRSKTMVICTRCIRTSKKTTKAVSK